MDALALLCNLHADGPATLSILRQVGYDTLEDIREAKIEDIEALLGVTTRIARRLQREAGVLAERLDDRPDVRPGGGLLEPLTLEEGEPTTDDGEEEELGFEEPLDSALEAALEEEGEFLDDDDDEEEFEEFDEGEYEEEEELDEPEAAEAEELDEEPASEPNPVPAILAERAEDEPVVMETAIDTAEESSARSEEPDEAEEGAARFPLVPGSFEGLTGLLAEKLLREGIETIGDFVNGDPLEISGKIGLGYTRLLRLQFLARRHLRSLDRAAERDVEIVPSPPPSEDRLEASGPFA